MAKSKRANRLEELAAQIRVCVKCPLYASRTNAVPGDGRNQRHLQANLFERGLRLVLVDVEPENLHAWLLLL